MTEIDSLEAREKLDQLLERAQAGEEVVITRDGKAVARLMPPPPAFDRERARLAGEAIKKMSKGVTLGGLKIKDLIDEGRA